MKNFSFSFLCFFILFSALGQQKNVKLWYTQPAKDWNEALPIGNGRLGAMIFGRASEEILQLNEQSLWTGGPAQPDPNPSAYQFLQPVRDALFRDSIGQAVSILRKMQGPNSQMYQPLGDLIIRQKLFKKPDTYYRDLDISTAVSTTQFTVEQVTYTREIFSSAPDQVIVIRMRSSLPKKLNFSVHVTHELKYEKQISASHELVLKGKARITSDDRRAPKPFVYADSNGCNGMRFQFRIKAITKEGIISNTDSTLNIANATEVLLIVSAATSFNGYDKCPDKEGKNEEAIATHNLQVAAMKSWQQLLTRHINDYQKYFNRVTLSLTDAGPNTLPTDKRLVAYREGKEDKQLEELYFQFGRYLLISCSRPGGFPANLQGIWNNQIRPPWRSNYTTNINVQMNYWMAQPTNLYEMAEPLIQHIKRLAKNGKETARNYYHMRGWALHHNSDIWALTNPVGEGNGDPRWANWSLGSPWLSQHLYEHYRFTADKKFLRETAYPIMKEAALFCLDWLVKKDGWLVTAPSTSPENVYVLPSGAKGTVTVASAMDMEIIWDLFTNVIEADSILQTDRDFALLLHEKRNQLRPLQIGKNGNLVEWYADWQDEDPQHRHISHLFALHPGRQLSPLLDSSFAAACKKTLEIRGDGGTGWSKAWKINFWARLFDGNHAYKMYQELLKNSTLNNLFDTHPPFQIDGNFGATAGISEMLLQSHLNELHLLPALPLAWKEGCVKGLCARGNFETEIFWKDHQLLKAFVISKAGGTCNIRTDKPVTVLQVKTKNEVEVIDGKTYYLTSFPTSIGKKYQIRLN